MTLIGVILPLIGLLFLETYIQRDGLLNNILKRDVRLQLVEDRDASKCRTEEMVRRLPGNTDAERRAPTPSCGVRLEFGYRWLLVASLVFLGRAYMLREET